MTDGEFRTTVERLGKRITDLEQVVATATVPRDRDEDTGGAIRDAMWKCSKCSSLLAFYDKDQDVLRIRYKEHLVYTHIGVGGWVQVVCRSCGEPNQQEHKTEAQVAAEQASATTFTSRERSRPSAG
jgi:hypothetical protein